MTAYPPDSPDAEPSWAVVPDDGRAPTFDAYMARDWLPLHRFAYLVTLDAGRAEAAVADALADVRRRWDKVGRRPDPGAETRRLIAQAAGRDGAAAGGSGQAAGADYLWAARLPVRERAAAVLAFYEERDADEVAAIVGRGAARSLFVVGQAGLRPARDALVRLTEDAPTPAPISGAVLGRLSARRGRWSRRGRWAVAGAAVAAALVVGGVVFFRPAEPVTAEAPLPAPVAEVEPAALPEPEPEPEPAVPAVGDTVAIDLPSTLWAVNLTGQLDLSDVVVGPQTRQVTWRLPAAELDRLWEYGEPVSLYWTLSSSDFDTAQSTMKSGVVDLVAGQTEVVVEVDNLASLAGPQGIDVSLRLVSYGSYPTTVAADLWGYMEYADGVAATSVVIDADQSNTLLGDMTEYQDPAARSIPVRWGQALEFSVPAGTLPDGSSLWDDFVELDLLRSGTGDILEGVTLPATVAADGTIRIELPAEPPFNDQSPSAGDVWTMQARVPFVTELTNPDPGHLNGAWIYYLVRLDVTQ
jgi:hypothetical protein